MNSKLYDSPQIVNPILFCLCIFKILDKYSFYEPSLKGKGVISIWNLKFYVFMVYGIRVILWKSSK